jgi:hypothetical protein
MLSVPIPSENNMIDMQDTIMVPVSSNIDKLWFIMCGKIKLSCFQLKVGGKVLVEIYGCDRSSSGGLWEDRCHFTRHDKTMLIGADPKHVEDRCIRVTIHHCFFDGTRQRHPRLRFGKVHLYNNYTRGWGLYAVCASVEAQVHQLALGCYECP